MVVKGEEGKRVDKPEFDAGWQVVSVVNTDSNLQYKTRFFGQMPLVDGIHPISLGQSQGAIFFPLIFPKQMHFSQLDMTGGLGRRGASPLREA